MERHRQMTDEERLRAYKLRGEGNTYQAIADTLSQEAEDGRQFDRATIYRACRAMPRSHLDEPFQWHRLEEYGLPWEASSYLLTMWRDGQEGKLLPTKKRYVMPPPSVREVRWWWRIHLADPDTDMRGVWATAQQFVARELLHALLDKTVDMSDLMAYLAYRPWTDGEHLSTYLRAVKEGRIPAVKQFSMDLLDRAVDELPDDVRDRYFFMVPAAGDDLSDDEQGDEK